MSGVRRYIAQRGGLSPLDPPLCGTEVAVVLASDYDRLEKECERLKADRSACWAEFKVMTRSCLDAEKERDELRAQVAELKHQLETLRVEACKNDGK